MYIFFIIFIYNNINNNINYEQRRKIRKRICVIADKEKWLNL